MRKGASCELTFIVAKGTTKGDLVELEHFPECGRRRRKLNSQLKIG